VVSRDNQFGVAQQTFVTEGLRQQVGHTFSEPTTLDEDQRGRVFGDQSAERREHFAELLVRHDRVQLATRQLDRHVERPGHGAVENACSAAMFADSREHVGDQCERSLGGGQSDALRPTPPTVDDEVLEAFEGEGEV
jgi:hypothetical protein